MLRLLVALELLVIVVAGAATVAAFPVFALVDERAHYAFVQEVAEEGRLPFLGRDLVSEEVEALDSGAYPAPGRVDPAKQGLAAYSYEAFQPPLSYVVAAPVFRAAGDDHRVKLRALRGLGLVALLGAAALLWPLARRVAGERALGAYAVALTFLMWPAVVVRTVTVSNAALELVLGVAASLALWEAGTRRAPRWLLAAGLLIGLGLLTRTTFAVFAPVLLWVAVRGGYGWRPALAALALPVVLVAPWIASNVDRYGAPTGSAIVREMQEPFLNPTGMQYGVAELREPSGRLLNAVLAEEWWGELLPPWRRLLRSVAMAALFLVPLALAVRRRAPGARWLLAAPLGLGLALMVLGTLVGDWDFFYPRYLHATLPAFGVFAACVVPWRAAIPVAVALAGLWGHLSSVTPFAP